MVLFAAPRDGHACVQAGQAIRGDTVNFVVFAAVVFRPDAQRVSVGIFTGQIEQIDTSENRQEATKQRDGVDGIGGVETTEHDE